MKKKTLNPTYNEILRVKKIKSWIFFYKSFFLSIYFILSVHPPQFKVVMEVLKIQTLSVSVWHHDTFGRNAFLGKVDLDLSEWDFSNTQINEYALKPRVKVSNLLSPILVAVS